MPLKTAAPDPGVYPGTPEAEYRSWDAVNQSFLTDLLMKSPKHAMHRQETPSSSDAMDFGKAAHAFILQPELFDANFVVTSPGLDRRTKAGKAEWADVLASGKVPLRDEDHLRLCAIEQELEGHRLGRSLRNGQSEVAVVWDDAMTGLRCKGLLDAWFDGLIVDLKFTSDASLHGSISHVRRYGYDVQAAYYIDGAAQAFGMEPDDVSFILMTIEAEAPFGIRSWPMDEWVMRGRNGYRKALTIYADCKTRNHWPGYPDGLEELPMPKWIEPY